METFPSFEVVHYYNPAYIFNISMKYIPLSGMNWLTNILTLAEAGYTFHIYYGSVASYVDMLNVQWVELYICTA